MKFGIACNRLFLTLLLALAPTVLASTTWYVNGVSGGDSNNCLLATTACKTVRHAISLAASGDTIRVAAATYNENLTVGISLTILGSGAKTTIIDGGGVRNVITVPNGATNVTLSGATIRNGLGVGIYGGGGGVSNNGNLNIMGSTVSGNKATTGGCTRYCAARGGGIANFGTLILSQSTISANKATHRGCTGACFAWAGGVYNGGTLIINNSTLSGNSAPNGDGGGIFNEGPLTRINNSTLIGNSAGVGADISNYNYAGYKVALQNSIVGICSGTMVSNGYNLSSGNTCNLIKTGDLNNTEPLLGPLQYNGGPTQTMALPAGSPAIDAGNPTGCTDNGGHLLKTDQRGYPRPDKEDTGGCDIGAYELQSD